MLMLLLLLLGILLLLWATPRRARRHETSGPRRLMAGRCRAAHQRAAKVGPLHVARLLQLRLRCLAWSAALPRIRLPTAAGRLLEATVRLGGPLEHAARGRLLQ